MSRNLNIGCVLDESGTDGAECRRKVGSGRRIAGTIRSLVNARDLQFECARVLHEILLICSNVWQRKCYGKKRRDLELGLYSWIISEEC